jgi:hypothetical protein
MDGKYHIVRIPLKKLAASPTFMPEAVAGFGLRAEPGMLGGVYDFGFIWFEGEQPFRTPDLNAPRLFSEPPPVVIVTNVPELTVPKLTGPPPAINGLLDDPAWQQAARSSGEFTGIQGGAASARTRFMVCQDSNNLYLAVECFDTPERLKNLKALVSQHDDQNIWGDDAVEIFLGPSKDRREYYQIVVNSKGVTTDNYCADPTSRNPAWNPTYPVQANVGATSWVVELALPFAMFDRTAPDNRVSSWSFNIARERHPGETSIDGVSCWSPLLSTSLHTPERFGKLLGLPGQPPPKP